VAFSLQPSTVWPNVLFPLSRCVVSIPPSDYTRHTLRPYIPISAGVNCHFKVYPKHICFSATSPSSTSAVSAQSHLPPQPPPFLLNHISLLNLSVLLSHIAMILKDGGRKRPAGLNCIGSDRRDPESRRRHARGGANPDVLALVRCSPLEQCWRHN
jgi:hypothetical protein